MNIGMGLLFAVLAFAILAFLVFYSAVLSRYPGETITITGIIVLLVIAFYIGATL